MNNNELAFRYACEAYGGCDDELRVPRNIRDNRTQILVHDAYSNTSVVVSTDGKTIVVSIRGTSSIQEIDADVNISKVPCICCSTGPFPFCLSSGPSQFDDSTFRSFTDIVSSERNQGC
jgi:hypothetical protein